MNSPSFYDLPNDLLYHMSKYISTVEYFYLSQTSVKLRHFFHLLLFSRCRLHGNSSILKSSLTEWIIPDKVFYTPSKYSWFRNESVRVVIADDEHRLNEMTELVDLSQYPRLKSILISPCNKRNLVLTNCNPEIFDHAVYVDQTIFFAKEFLPILKTHQKLYSIEIDPFRDYPDKKRQTETDFAFNCIGIDQKLCIVSIQIYLINGQKEPDSYNLCSSLMSLDCFPNLKILRMFSNDYTPLPIFQEVITSLPKCPKLDKLIIQHESFQQTSYLEILDNLEGKWSEFSLILTCLYPIAYTLRLPSITELDINAVKAPGVKFEFGKKIKALITEFALHNMYIFSSKNDINVLDNLTDLSVRVSPMLLVQDDTGIHSLFTKTLPNLKTLDIGILRISNFLEIGPVVFEYFRKMLELSTFGDFDLLKPEHLHPLIPIMVQNCLKSSIISDIERQETVNNMVEILKTSSKNQELIKTYQQFYKLQFYSFSSNPSRVDEKFYVFSRSFLSLTFLSILQYLPNLNTLNLNSLSSIEEFPTLHRLSKYHKKLKVINIGALYQSPANFLDINDETYNRFCDSASAMTFDLNKNMTYLVKSDFKTHVKARFDIEAVRNKYQKSVDYLQLTGNEDDENNRYILHRNNSKFIFRISDPNSFYDPFSEMIPIML